MNYNECSKACSSLVKIISKAENNCLQNKYHKWIQASETCELFTEIP